MLILWVAPALSALGLMLIATAAGVPAMRKLIMVYEAKHELKEGSAGWLRTLRGWSLVAFWLMITWYVASIIGDWGVHGDLGDAIDRGWLRLHILFEIAMAIMESK